MKIDCTLPEEEARLLYAEGVAAEAEAMNELNKPQQVKKAYSPFQKADIVNKRLKLFLWGATGVGKTVLSLQFPDPVMIDLEGGADLYGDDFKFSVLRASTPDEVMQAVEWLLTNKHNFKTLAIDPVTVYWDALQKKWSDIFMVRNKQSKGYKYEFYDLQVKDWQTIKSEHKEFVRKLIALDMNVIVTAREKTKYKDGGFMVAAGETFDGEKSLPYEFDIVLQMYINPEGKRMAHVKKDRSNSLPPKDFEISYQVFEQCFSKTELTRESTHTEMITDEQIAIINEYLTSYKLTPEQVTKRLAAYDAESVSELSMQNADKIIQKFKDKKKEK